LADAEDSIKADPSFHKAYMRKAVVLESQAKMEEVSDTLYAIDYEQLRQQSASIACQTAVSFLYQATG